MAFSGRAHGEFPRPEGDQARVGDRRHERDQRDDCRIAAEVGDPQVAGDDRRGGEAEQQVAKPAPRMRLPRRAAGRRTVEQIGGLLLVSDGHRGGVTVTA